MAYIFVHEDSQWFHRVLDVLSDIDPKATSRVSVRSSNPITAYSKKVQEIETAALRETMEKYRVYTREIVSPEQKIYMLKSLESAPSYRDTMIVTDAELLPEGLHSYNFHCGEFWKQLLAGKNAPLQPLLFEQVEWARDAYDTFVAKKANKVTPKQKIYMLKSLESAPSYRDTMIVTDAELLPEGLHSYNFHCGEFWRNFLRGDNAPLQPLLFEQVEWARDAYDTFVASH